jgi:hypothetical protein
MGKVADYVAECESLLRDAERNKLIRKPKVKVGVLTVTLRCMASSESGKETQGYLNVYRLTILTAAATPGEMVERDVRGLILGVAKPALQGVT